LATRWAQAVWAGSACLGARAAPRRQVLAQYTRPIPQRQEGTFRPPGGGPRMVARRTVRSGSADR
jgi:hypothetical protein